VNILDLIPSPFRLGAMALAVVVALGALGGVAAAIDRHGHDKAVAELQPKLDQANQTIGTLKAANDANEATIRTLTAEAAANDLLTQQYADRVTALNQQADDVAATIRKLQQDDQTVDAYLRTPVPAALRGVLNHPAAANDPGATDAHGSTAAAR
jgi:hypothetical protein